MYDVLLNENASISNKELLNDSLRNRKNELVTEGIIYNKLHKLGLITSYSQICKTLIIFYFWTGVF